MNKVILTGRLGADPELRYTQAGTAVARFNLAVERNMGKDKEKETDWLTVVAWGKKAEFVANYLSKGRKVLIQGNLRASIYEDKAGEKRKSVEVQAEDIEFCDSKPDGNQGAMGGGFTEVTDEDVPF